MGYAKYSNIQTWTPQHHSCLNPLNAVSSKTEVAIWVNFIDMILKERIDESKISLLSGKKVQMNKYEEDYNKLQLWVFGNLS